MSCEEEKVRVGKSESCTRKRRVTVIVARPSAEVTTVSSTTVTAEALIFNVAAAAAISAFLELSLRRFTASTLPGVTRRDCAVFVEAMLTDLMATGY
jgi:hypothetical protein